MVDKIPTIKNDDEYKLWVQDIGTRFKRSQIKAATIVNSEMLVFYWGIGADIVKNKNLFSYGSDFQVTRICNNLLQILKLLIFF